MSRKQKKNRNRKKFKKMEHDLESLFESDEYFGFIAGYTPNGVPFGLTHKEWDEINSEVLNEKNYEDEIK